MKLKRTIVGVTIIISIGLISILYLPSLNKGVYHLLVNSMLEESVPYIYNSEIDVNNDLILDTRTFEEYAISHIPNAIWTGEENAKMPAVDKTSKIILYCSLGKRSEIQGEQLIQNGYTNVHNLYGGIIEWHNDGLTTMDSSNILTEAIHPYSWFWGLWIW